MGTKEYHGNTAKNVAALGDAKEGISLVHRSDLPDRLGKIQAHLCNPQKSPKSVFSDLFGMKTHPAWDFAVSIDRLDWSNQ